MAGFETWPEAAHRHYEEQVDHVVRRLREMAEAVERVALDVREARTGLNRNGPHVQSAQRAIHEAMWGLANANLDSLVRAAGEADAAKDEG